MSRIDWNGVVVGFAVACLLGIGVTAPVYPRDVSEDHDTGTPEEVRLMNELKKASPSDYSKVFAGFFDNGEVKQELLDHPGLQKVLRKIGEDFFYKKVIRGNYFRHKEDISGTAVGTRVISSFRSYRRIVVHRDGRTGVKIWMKILPHPPAGGPMTDTVAMKLKTHGRPFIRHYLREISFQPRLKRDKFLYLRMSNWEKLMRSLYEAVRFHWDELSPGLRKRVLKFAQKALRWDRNQILLQEQKTFAIATFLDRGFTESQIKDTLKVPERVKWYEGGTSPGSRFVPGMFNTAQSWREEYPRWPVDESSTDDDSHQNDRGEGHEKKKGEGHTK